MLGIKMPQLRVRAVVFVFLVALSSGHALAQKAEVDTDSFQVMSYNVRYLNQRDGLDVWNNRKTAVKLQVAVGDVVGLQEVVAEQFDYLADQLPEYGWVAVGRNDGKRDGEMVPVGWRKSRFEKVEAGHFWLSETPDEVGSVGWDAALPRIATYVKLRCRLNGDAFWFINAHFDHRGREARVESARQLHAWVAQRSDEMVVLVGDLNATLDSAPLKALVETKESVLVDARRVSQQEDRGPEGTWNGFKKIEPRRIDHVLVAGPLKVMSFETLDPRTESGRFASDHLPVMATLRMKE